MLIANPIYDLVFKYLMENLDIAKGVISTIIDEEIIHIDFQARESTIKSPEKFTFFHLDFIARIRDKQGKSKDVLIELQKTNVLFDILRFRRYLGSQYRKEEEVIQPDGSSAKESLPIVTIYFLGFFLSKTLPAVIKVDRQYIDVLLGKTIEERHDFIECLTHDSYVIQIPGLKLDMKNRLEYVLSIFKQEKLVKGDNRLKDYAYDIEDELLQKILVQLTKAAADNDLLEQMEIEELAQHEYETAFAPLERKIEKHEKIIEENKKTIEENIKTIEENIKTIEEKEKAIEEKEITIEEKEKTIEEKEKAIEENKKTIEEKDKYIRELLKKLEGTDKK
jgi:hypothetical protein